MNKECHKDCLYTCANKCELVDPPIKAVGMRTYSSKYSFAFCEGDIIELKPWWFGEYKEKEII